MTSSGMTDTPGVTSPPTRLNKARPISLVVGPLMVVLLGFAQTFRSTELPRSQNTLFSGSGNCATCHSPDVPERLALRNSDGNDVSPPSLWRSTMMANAAKDPFWQAKVSAEVAANPGLKEAIEDKCTTCHAPMGRTEAIATGATSYSVEEMRQDPLAMDGVSCTVCHQIQPGNLGTEASFSGGFEIRDGQTIFGPYQDPLGWPMLALSGFDPIYSEHMGSSELCASCHTLFTNSFDEQGNATGRLAEQTPYLEWLNSIYPAEDVQCQSCHMPVEGEEIVISNTPRTLAARSPFYRHEFVGGNAFMLTMLRDNAAELGVTAESAHFDSTIARTRRMLGSATATLDTEISWDGDTLNVSVLVRNSTGHKIPTGYPSRRMWIDLAVRRGEQEMFRSGGWDPNTGEIAGIDAGFEPHQTIIRDPDQVQIYQSIMGDPDGIPVFGLIRATGYLKDNRIPPKGWIPGGPWSDDTGSRGRANRDSDFNAETGAAGSGSDRVTYRIPLSDGGYQVDVRLRYQTIAPRFADALLAYGTEEVDRFRDMYQAMDLAPELIDSVTVQVGVASNVDMGPDPVLEQPLVAFPNPTDQPVTLVRSIPSPVVVYDISGRLIRRLSQDAVRWDLRDQAGRTVSPGVYFLVTRFSAKAVPVTVLR